MQDNSSTFVSRLIVVDVRFKTNHYALWYQNLEHGPYISLRPRRLCGEFVDTESSAQKVSTLDLRCIGLQQHDSERRVIIVNYSEMYYRASMSPFRRRITDNNGCGQPARKYCLVSRLAFFRVAKSGHYGFG